MINNDCEDNNNNCDNNNCDNNNDCEDNNTYDNNNYDNNSNIIKEQAIQLAKQNMIKIKKAKFLLSQATINVPNL